MKFAADGILGSVCTLEASAPEMFGLHARSHASTPLLVRKKKYAPCNHFRGVRSPQRRGKVMLGLPVCATGSDHTQRRASRLLHGATAAADALLRIRCKACTLNRCQAWRPPGVHLHSRRFLTKLGEQQVRLRDFDGRIFAVQKVVKRLLVWLVMAACRAIARQQHAPCRSDGAVAQDAIIVVLQGPGLFASASVDRLDASARSGRICCPEDWTRLSLAASRAILRTSVRSSSRSK